MNLLSPGLLAEIVVEVRPDGTHQLFQSKSALSPAQVVQITRALIESAAEFVAQYGPTPAMAEEITRAWIGVAVTFAERHGLKVEGSLG